MLTILNWHRRRSSSNRSRRAGQGVVEFALVFPVLLLFLMMAIDFGRIYLGWVNLQNMARIASNYAANNATGFATNDPATLAAYQVQIRNDATVNNCQLPKVGGVETAPAPVFSGYHVGDTATVGLSCSFGVITPIISGIVGNAVTVSASSQFPVKTGIVTGINTGGGGGGGTAVTASFTCTPTSGAVPLNVQCNDESGGTPTAWQWAVTGPGGTTQTSGIQDPFFTLPDVGSYSVSLTADNALNQPSTMTRGNYIVGGTPSNVDFIADKNSGMAPLTVKFTDQSTGNPTAWKWDFDVNAGATVDSTAQNPTFVYAQPGTYAVKLTATNAAGTLSATKQSFIVVGVPDCTVPSFTGVKRNNAPPLWSGAGFAAANLTDKLGAPNGNYVIGFQSITAGSIVPCNSTIQVSDK